MASTFLGIELGKRSLMAHQAGLHVIGHNLSNADNKTYSRQRAILSASDPLYEPAYSREETAGQLGQGVEVTSIRRERDQYLDVRIGVEASHRSYWKSNQMNLRQIEDIHHAMEGHNLQEALDAFWSSWQELSKNPSEPAVRQELIEHSLKMSRQFRRTFDRLNTMRLELNEKVRSDVTTINTVAQALADINTKIVQSQALRDNPNDLMDKRDGLIQELSTMINVRTSLNDQDEIMVFVGGKMLVQGTKINSLRLESNPNNEGLLDIYWESSDDRLVLESGSLRANLVARDEHLQKQISRLDTLSLNVMTAVNDVHRKGFDRYGRTDGLFFEEKFLSVNLNGDYDRNNDGIDDSTLVFQVTGNQALDVKEPVGFDGIVRLRKDGNLIEVPYQADDRIEEVIDRINFSGAEISLHLGHDKRLIVKGTSSGPEPFAIDYLEDTSSFLVGLTGILQSSNLPFQHDVTGSTATFGVDASVMRTAAHHPSGWMTVRENLLKDAGVIAASSGSDYDATAGDEVSHGVGDGRIALDIASLRHAKIMFDKERSFNEYYIHMVEDIGSKGAIAGVESEKYDAIVANLEALQQSVAGVNIDEEMAHMINMQHGYRASAKLVSVIDEMLNTLINTMG